MNNPTNLPEITEIVNGEAVESSRSMRVGPDLQAGLSAHYAEQPDESIVLRDVVDGDRDRVQVDAARDQFDDDFAKLAAEEALCDAKMAELLDPETGKVRKGYEGAYRRWNSRKQGLIETAHMQAQIAYNHRQARYAEAIENAEADARRVEKMGDVSRHLSIRDNGRAV